MNVIVVPVPEQIVVEPLIVAIGIPVTVTIALPVCNWLQLIGEVVAILTKLYVVFIIKFPVDMLAFPVASKGIVWLVPPLIV